MNQNLKPQKGNFFRFPFSISHFPFHFWRWTLVGIGGLLGALGLGLILYQATHEADPHRQIREAYSKQQKSASGGSVSEVQTINQQERPQDRNLQKVEIIPGMRPESETPDVKPPLEVSTQLQEKKVIEGDVTPPPVFDEPAIPQALLDQTPPTKQTAEKIKTTIAPGRYRFNNQSPDAVAGNVIVSEDHNAKDYNLDTFAPEMEDIDLALMDNINSSTLELDVAAGVWTPFYFQGRRLLEVGDKLRGQASPGRQRDRLIVKFTKVIKKDGRSLPIQGISLAVDGTLGIPGEKVGNIFQAASGPLLAELIRGVSETFQDREKAVISGSGVTSDIPSKTLKNAGIRGSQRVLEKIEELMSEELEENKPYLFIRAGTRLRCRLQTAVDVSQADYGKWKTFLTPDIADHTDFKMAAQIKVYNTWKTKTELNFYNKLTSVISVLSVVQKIFSPSMSLKSFDEISTYLYFYKESKEMKGLLSSKGQVTIPKKIRHFLGIGPGDGVDFKVVAGHVELGAVLTEKKGLAGSLKKYARKEKPSEKGGVWKKKVAHGIISEGLSH